MDKIRVLLLGIGNFGSTWAQEVLPACGDFCGFAGAVDQNAERFRYAPRGVACFADLDTALSAIQPQLVINVTPPALHTETNLHLLSLGYPVLCEKPIAESLGEAEKMLAYYEEQGGFLMIAENYRYAPVFRKCKMLLRSGEMGDIHSVQCHFSHFHPDASHAYHGKLAQPLLLDVTVHHLDVARYLIGAEPVQTHCETWSAPYSWYQHRPANAVIWTRMSSGVRFHYFGTLATPAGTTDWNGDWEIECEKGTLRINGSKLYRYTEPEGLPVPVPLDGGETESRIPMLREAAKALCEGRKGETDLADNIKTYRWVQEAIRSSQDCQQG